MGQICLKLKNPDYSRQTEELMRSPFHLLDSIKLPDYPERQLKFYRDLDDKFCVLNNILLSDYMTLLNNFSKGNSDAAGSGKHKNIKTDKITKNDWKKFCENKIIKNPIVKKTSTDLQNCQKQFFDDIADDIRLFYALQNKLDIDDELEIPKIAFFSVGFNYCYPKISQKIIILLSLFTDSGNEISCSDDLYLFFLLIFSNVFRTPVLYLAKELGPDVPNESIWYSIRLEEAESITKINELIIREIVLMLAEGVIGNLFGENQSKAYSREEFKNTLLDDKFVWIFSNKGIKMKIEEELTRRNIGI
jgi:hypothetical protein